MINFLKIFTSIGNAEERRLEKIFNDGKKAGYEEGFQNGRRMTIHNTEKIADEELNEIYKFLAERNIVFCYDLSINGLRMRRLNQNK